jgi:pimeloyl-ACP methyl ester carboxylesterase
MFHAHAKLTSSKKAINSEFNHFKVEVDIDGYGPLPLHYVHEISDRKDAIPLLFSHGWPGNFLEIRKVIKQLAHPESASDPAFQVVAPSIPGFGFSPAPTKPGIGPTKVAQAFDKIMHKVLGYQKYILQGGDFGSFITRSMTIQFPARVRAQHLNMFPVKPPTIRQPIPYMRYLLSSILYSDWEKEAMRFRKNFELDQSGYLEQQKTRPQTLGIALGDSPLGLLAWFMEKFHDWMDENNYKLSNKEIITFVMMHWIQGATPGLRFYYEAFYASNDTETTFETYVAQPTGVSMYPKEQLHASQASQKKCSLANNIPSAHATGRQGLRIFSFGRNIQGAAIFHLLSARSNFLRMLESSLDPKSLQKLLQNR